MTQVSPVTQTDAQAFCDLCQWVYECWAVHSNLFERLPAQLEEERNVSLADLMETPYGACLDRLNQVSHEYIILQIAKLHDPAIQGQNENLSIDFFVRQAFWSEGEESTIREISAELNGFTEQIRDARNKILAHNDRLVFGEGSLLGSFSEGDDERYFRDLGVLCSMIWNKFPNRNVPYGTRVFEFKKSGIDGESLCPSNEASELRELIVNALPTARNRADPK